MALEQGHLSEFKGMSLDDINMASNGTNAFLFDKYEKMQIFFSSTL